MQVLSGTFDELMNRLKVLCLYIYPLRSTAEEFKVNQILLLGCRGAVSIAGIRKVLDSDEFDSKSL